MAEQLDPKELVTIEDLAVSNMWEVAALVAVLERKGILKRKKLYDVVQELRAEQPRPEHLPPPLSKPEQAIIDRIFAVIHVTGLTNHQAKALLAKVYRMIEQEERTEHKATHYRPGESLVYKLVARIKCP